MADNKNNEPNDAFEEDRTYEVVPPRVAELLQRGEIDMQIATARQYPRDLARVKKRMLSFATLDEETAESCFYTLKRQENNKTKFIYGPSVRLAEIAVACYGNLRAAARVTDNDGRQVAAQGVCHDLEVNSLVCMETRRRITNKNGKTYSEDMQIMTGNAAAAIAFRNAVFKVVPGALIKPVYDECRRVAVGDATTLVKKRDKLFKRFEAMGVTAERVLKAVEKTSIENIGLEELEHLIGIGTAIRDNETNIDEAFPEERGSQEKVDDVLSKKLAFELGYSEEQIKDCLGAGDLVAALRKKYGMPNEKSNDKSTEQASEDPAAAEQAKPAKSEPGRFQFGG